MNLLVGFVILLCLVGSEIHTAEVTPELWQRIFLVGLISISVPGLAFFQTLIVSKRFRETDLPELQRESIIQRLSICHSAVWLSASLATILALRWQDVVRGNWNLDRFPLLDELLILMPILLSLVASWAIFYEIQKSAVGTKESAIGWASIKNRLSYVSIRFRVYILLVLAPITIAVLLRDLAPWISSQSLELQFAIFGITCVASAIGFPFLLLVIWKHRPVPAALRSRLIATCKRHQLQVLDIRIWQTGGQVVNALVAGFVPKLRFILLSDRLVDRFPENELLAVVRHEAGHLRLWHLPIRLVFIVLPLIALTLDENNALGLLSGLGMLVELLGLPKETAIGILSLGYIVYLVLSMSWLSRNMEFEADIYSCQELPHTTLPTISSDYVADMSDALLRLIGENPNQFRKRTLLHPSIEERMRVLRDLDSSPEKAARFCHAFARRQRVAIGLLFSLCILAFIAKLL